MHALILATLALCASDRPIEDGSILMLQNSNKVVSSFTNSKISHVAVLMNLEGKPWVYEATPAKVRRVPLKTYISELSEFNRGRRPATTVWLKRPNRPLNKRELFRLRSYLDSQLGRRYSVRGYVREKPGEGIHCAALTAEAVESTGRIDFKQPQRENPMSVMRNVRHLYRYGEPILIPAPRPVTEPMHVRAWHKVSDFRHWCTWSFIESLRFCF